MTNLAPTVAPASVEIAPGVRITNSMSPAERYAIVKAANIAPPQGSNPTNASKFAFEERDAKQAAAKAANDPKTKQFNAKANSLAELEKWANGQDENWQRQNEPMLQEWAKQIMAGTHFAQRTAGGYELHQTSSYTLGLAVDRAAKATDAEGFAPGAAITGPLLHGYVLPPGRTYHVADLVAHLKMARAGNLSQSQVDAIIKAGL